MALTTLRGKLGVLFESVEVAPRLDESLKEELFSVSHHSAAGTMAITSS